MLLQLSYLDAQFLSGRVLEGLFVDYEGLDVLFGEVVHIELIIDLGMDQIQYAIQLEFDLLVESVELGLQVRQAVLLAVELDSPQTPRVPIVQLDQESSYLLRMLFQPFETVHVFHEVGEQLFIDMLHFQQVYLLLTVLLVEHYLIELLLVDLLLFPLVPEYVLDQSLTVLSVHPHLQQHGQQLGGGDVVGVIQVVLEFDAGQFGLQFEQ